MNRKGGKNLIILTRRWALSSMKRSSIWPKSAALPWEYKNVNLAKGCFQKVATILFPTFVSRIRTSTFLSAVMPENTNPPSDSRKTSYVGGSGGKNANFAATVPVTFPILLLQLVVCMKWNEAKQWCLVGGKQKYLVKKCVIDFWERQRGCLFFVLGSCKVTIIYLGR